MTPTPLAIDSVTERHAAAATPTGAAIAPGTAAAAPTVGPSPWSLWQRLLFRYSLLHVVLYVVVPEGWWQPVTTWMHEHGLAPYEVIHQQTGSGDTGHDFAKLIAIGALAVLGTVVWSFVQRRPCGYPRLGRWLHAGVRFWIATVLLSYGLHKFYGGQFGSLGLMRMTTPVGDLAPMTMVGTFMQASKPYELFGGGGEVLAGLLLFHRRTALIGALVAIAVMLQVAALNWLCGVPVKLFSLHLLLFAIGLLAPYAPGLCALAIANRPSRPVDLSLARRRWLRVVLAVLGWGFVLWFLASSHVQGMQPRPWMQGRERGPLYGLWQVQRMLLDGDEVPAHDARRWRWFAIDEGKMAWADESSGRRHFFEFVLEESGKSARVGVRRGNEATAPETWTLEAGTKVVKVRTPLALRAQDRWRPVDGERRSLVLRGTWDGKALELHTVEKLFPLQTGFRLRQELPDGW